MTQKQKTAKPHSGFEGLAYGGAEIAVPDIGAAIASAEKLLGNIEADRQAATSLNGVPGRWTACPCGLFDCELAEFVPD
jgi:hypothetical protein